MTRLQDWFYKYNAWSFTRHRLWGGCKRAYYYRYIGPALHSSPDFSVYRLKQLKKLDSKFVLQGKLVHDAIENQIGQFHFGHGMNEEAAGEQYVQQVERYRRGAKELLVEYFNGQTTSEAFFDRIREDGLDQLSMFFGFVWPQLEDSEYLRHEKFDRFRANSSVEAIVKVDYASRTKDGMVIISDWKTGVDNPEYESDLQAGAYVLWAAEFFDLKPQRVRNELVYLTTGVVRTYEFSADQLEEIRSLIIREFKEMNESYNLGYFDSSPEPRKCLSCPFASVCPSSMASQQLNG